MNSGTEKSRKVLGKGLSALLPSRPSQAAQSPTGPSSLATALPVDAIQPNPMQPRTVFHPDRLEELAASIRTHGIIQPLIVRSSKGNYQIVAGERRWRAAKLAGLASVPVVIQDIADPTMLEVALIENLQREDLNPIETAHAYDRLVRDLGLTPEQIGQRTGKDRTSIINTLRLLKLPPSVQLLVAEHRVSMGHARAILGLPNAEDQIQLAEKAAAQGLSVRQVEALVQESTSAQGRRGARDRKGDQQDPNVRAAVEQLERTLGTRVRIVELSEQRGRIEIEYYSQVDLDRLYKHIVGEA